MQPAWQAMHAEEPWTSTRTEQQERLNSTLQEGHPHQQTVAPTSVMDAGSAGEMIALGAYQCTRRATPHGVPASARSVPQSSERHGLSLAEIRNMAVGTNNGAFGRYATTPTEIWARAFNQYFTMRHGSAEAIEDMLLKASRPLWSEVPDSAKNITEFWYGYQWRADELEELIAPHVEKVLKHLGVIE